MADNIFEQAIEAILKGEADRATIFTPLIETACAPVAMTAVHLGSKRHAIADGVALRVRPDLDQSLGRIRRLLPCWGRGAGAFACLGLLQDRHPAVDTYRLAGTPVGIG